MFTAVVIDAEALPRLEASGRIEPSWLKDFGITDPADNISLRVVNEKAYILSKLAKPESRLLIIRLEEGAMFDELKEELRPEAFRRVLRVAHSTFDPSISIPVSWRSYNAGSYISFQSNTKTTGVTTRVEMDRGPRKTRHVYAFHIGDDESDLATSHPNYVAFDSALSDYTAALKTRPQFIPPPESRESQSYIDLADELPSDLSYGLSVSQWYDAKLTREQRRFVDFPSTQSIRLRGPAGTGKTLSLVVKCLKMLYAADDKSEGLRIGFLTHSQSTVELVEALLRSMDERGVLYAGSTNAVLRVSTLQALANEAMAFDLHGLAPLSNDGFEGRQLQLELLDSVIAEFRSGDWIAFSRKCSQPFSRYVESEPGSTAGRYFCWEVMNEFACVLDADGVRDSWERKQRYLEEKRKSWAMHLENSTLR